jgi:DNA-binding response OmpR family regulator
MTDSKRIYVVDDDPDICESCQFVLEGKGFSVQTYGSAASGLAAIRAKCPDLLILDVMIEEADSGFQTARTLAPEFPKLPILMLSSIVGDAKQIFDVSTLPVAELIEKPVEPTELLQRVEALIARTRP